MSSFLYCVIVSHNRIVNSNKTLVEIGTIDLVNHFKAKANHNPNDRSAAKVTRALMGYIESPSQTELITVKGKLK